MRRSCLLRKMNASKSAVNYLFVMGDVLLRGRILLIGWYRTINKNVMKKIK